MSLEINLKGRIFPGLSFLDQNSMSGEDHRPWERIYYYYYFAKWISYQTIF